MRLRRLLGVVLLCVLAVGCQPEERPLRVVGVTLDDGGEVAIVRVPCLSAWHASRARGTPGAIGDP